MNICSWNDQAQSINIISDRLPVCHTVAELGVLSISFFFFSGRRRQHRQLRERRWQICLTTNVHLSAYWRTLSQWWFMPKFPPHATTSITSNNPRSNALAYPSAPNAETKSGLVIFSFHAFRSAKRTLISLGRIWKYHLFSFSLPSLSQRRITLYVYEWSCLLVYTRLLF